MDELLKIPPTTQSAIENSIHQEEFQHRYGSTEQNLQDTNSQEVKTENSLFFDIHGESNFDSKPCQREDSCYSGSHRKTIQGKFFEASNPDDNFKISKFIELDPFAPKEAWLNLDDFKLQTLPSHFPPPSRPAPLREIDSSPSTSNQENTQKEQQGEAIVKDLEHFLSKIPIKRRLNYELAEEDIYDNQPEPINTSWHTKQQEDLIDIFTLDIDDNVVDDNVALKLHEETHLPRQVEQVTKTIKEDLSTLFSDNGIPTSSKTTITDRKGKGVIKGNETLSGENGIPINSKTTIVDKKCKEVIEGNGARQPSTVITMMRERDLKQQREREDIDKVANELGSKFKKWSTGKEGNLRALLSSLQNILGHEFGWQPIPMKDLLESTSVRKQYKRAILLVHPDKLQQKSATPQQKYIAEKVFGLLKEASKKFNNEEIF